MPHRPRSLSSARRRRLASRAPAIFIIALLAIAALAMSARAWLAPAPMKGQSSAAPTGGSGYVNRARLWPQLHKALSILGTRLEKPGQERLTLLGTISRAQQAPAATLPMRLILEFPDKLRLEEQIGQQWRITVFGEQGLGKAGGSLKREDEDEIESLLFDSAEHFFAGQTQGLATRALGARFRLDDGTAENYSGPYYDIYQMNDHVQFGPALRVQPKFFYFNSQTQLLERVRYELKRDGGVVNVETLIGGWQKVNNQHLPGTITRLENGLATLVLTVTSASFNQRAADGIFAKP
jgi:hypothetical protein